jgi:hypothetical protein
MTGPGEREPGPGQGRRPEQYELSADIAAACAIAFVLLAIAGLIGRCAS